MRDIYITPIIFVQITIGYSCHYDFLNNDFLKLRCEVLFLKTVSAINIEIKLWFLDLQIYRVICFKIKGVIQVHKNQNARLEKISPQCE